ncbi:MAG: DUF4113 domain-containing protein [Methylococcales bacterium]|nr:DUF4113 domain-containing protein [Methylococcales bacterium]
MASHVLIWNKSPRLNKALPAPQLWHSHYLNRKPDGIGGPVYIPCRRKSTGATLHANSISVFIQTSPFAQSPYYGGSLTVALPSPSNDTRLLVKTALWIVKRLYKPDYVYQKAGVLLNDLVPEAGRQRDLFFDATEPNYAQSAKVMAVLDPINQRYGRQTLKLENEGFKALWQMKQNFKSLGYTTHWNELIQAS